MRLETFVIKRLFLMLIVLFGVSVVVFVVARAIPADPVGAILGGNAPIELLDEMRGGLWLLKLFFFLFFFFSFVGGGGGWGLLLRTTAGRYRKNGGFFSPNYRATVGGRLYFMFYECVSEFFSAVHRNKLIDHFCRVFSILGVSMPVFWTGLLLLILFYYRLGWLPGSGRVGIFTYLPPKVTGLLLLDSLLAGNFEAFKDALSHIILPAVVLGYSSTASIARIMRSSMLDVLRQDFIRTARAKGIGRKLVIYRHALRNALIPVVTVIGLTFGGLLEGAVLTETIFGWPGLGRYIVNSLLLLDYPAIMGGTLFVAIVYSLVNLVVDIIYAALDPRMRV